MSICEMCIKLHLEIFFGIDYSILTDAGKYWNRKSCVHSIELNQTFKISKFRDFFEKFF